RYGMIKFGSRTDVLVPAGTQRNVAVKPGDKVRGGRTVLFRVGGDNGTSQVRYLLRRDVACRLDGRPNPQRAPSPVPAASRGHSGAARSLRDWRRRHWLTLGGNR